MDTLPIELQNIILSLLSFPDRVSAVQVCSLWKAILDGPMFLKERYLELRHHPEGKNVRAHQLLYNKLGLHDICAQCAENWVEHTDLENDSRDALDPCEIEVPSRKPVSLTAPLDPTSRKIVNYNFYLEACPQHNSDEQKAIDLPIPLDHPFLKEPAILAPACASVEAVANDEKKNKKSKKSFVHVIGFVRFLDGYKEFNCGRIPMNLDPTVYELTQKLWGKLEAAYTSEQLSRVARYKLQVRFRLVHDTSETMWNWADGMPVSYVELEVDGPSTNTWSTKGFNFR
ncbi:hypothetical protein TWF481_004943 [Arthrobotrys musiformis]|uniref:F-box domain-containing protein n=1 Tax=Arthrobotrys musiformis TaxID=47236 RepID=A0AAV9WN60_9PEZI